MHSIPPDSKLYKHNRLSISTLIFHCPHSFTQLMGSLNFYCVNTLVLVSLLLLSSTHLSWPVEGRATLGLGETDKGGGLVVEEMIIGSRPPRCTGRCEACGHCEAVQMPAVPQSKRGIGGSTKVVANSRDEYSSNYKPMGWKCKCGDFIFNP